MMRIEQVISRYGNQEYDQLVKKRLRHRTAFKGRSSLEGCVDMLSLSMEIIDTSDGFADLVAFTRMIPDETAKEWVKNAFGRAGSREDGLIDKLIIEIL